MNLASGCNAQARLTPSVRRSGTARACCAATARSRAASRGSPARCASACGSRPATASPSPPRTARTISKCSTRSGMRGLPRCRPTPSCTARSSATFSNIPARGCASPRDGLDGEIAPHAPKTLERLIVDRQRRIREAVRRRSDRASCRARRTISPGCSTPRAPPAGRRARCSPTRCWRRRATPMPPRSTPCSPGDPILHAAPMSHGSGLYIMAHVMRRGVNVVPESGGFEPEEIFQLFERLAAHLDVRGADHGQAAGRMRRPIATGENIRTIVWGGAPMYVEDALQGARPLRPAARADLRAGRKPDDHHGAVEGATSPTAIIRAGASGSPRPAGRSRCIEVMVADARGPRAAGGRDRRNPLPRRHRDGGLLAQSGGERRDARRAAGCTPATSARSMPTAI